MLIAITDTVNMLFRLFFAHYYAERDCYAEDTTLLF